MVDPATFFRHGRVLCRKCGKEYDFESSGALYHADLSTPCGQCGFLFLGHMDRQVRKLIEIAGKDPEWVEPLHSGRTDVIKQRLDELVPLPQDG